MSLKDTIQNDMKEAMKAKDALRLSVLRMVKAKFMEFETSGADKEVDDDKAVSLIQNLIKQRQEAAKAYTDNNRQELADKELAEVDILKAYLPEGVSEEDIQAAVNDAVSKTGASDPKDMGKVMGMAMGTLKKTGKIVDGALVQKLVKEAFS